MIKQKYDILSTSSYNNFTILERNISHLNIQKNSSRSKLIRIANKKLAPFPIGFSTYIPNFLYPELSPFMLKHDWKKRSEKTHQSGKGAILLVLSPLLSV